MRVLVVEDEARMAALIKQGLEEDAYAVDVVSDGSEALDWVQSVTYDRVLLDIMLPGIDGIEVCRLLRAKGHTMPILMLTARDTTADKVQGLDSGADDYLVKPFAIEELTARLRALTRRESPNKTPECRRTQCRRGRSWRPAQHPSTGQCRAAGAWCVGLGF